VAGSGPALKHAAELLDLDPRLEILRVELVGRRRKEDVDSRPMRELRVPRLVPWIAGEILVLVELRRVDEEADDHEVALVARGPDQREMALVKGPHRRDETDRPLPVGQRSLQRGDGGSLLHGAVASARTR
jgi:hypothetical protein